MLFPHAYVSMESIDCNLLSAFELKTISFISSVKTIRVSLLNLCYVFNNNLLIFMNSLLFLRLSILIIFFLDGLCYSQFELFVNSFYSFQI